MTETNDVPEAPAKGKRQRPARQRKNYAAELAALQARVDMAQRVLSRCTGAGTVDAAVLRELCAIAAEALKGEQ